jgi:hypothetical protein
LGVGAVVAEGFGGVAVVGAPAVAVLGGFVVASASGFVVAGGGFVGAAVALASTDALAVWVGGGSATSGCLEGPGSLVTVEPVAGAVLSVVGVGVGAVTGVDAEVGDDWLFT